MGVVAGASTRPTTRSHSVGRLLAAPSKAEWFEISRKEIPGTTVACHFPPSGGRVPGAGRSQPPLIGEKKRCAHCFFLISILTSLIASAFSVSLPPTSPCGEATSLIRGRRGIGKVNRE